MTAYYNEIDPYAAQWLRNLIDAGHIARGVVDERSIEDVRPADLVGFRQCHFFAGIGIWSLALRSAGVPDDAAVWTGSCPCQPFSVAGKGGGMDDKRHLWPAFFHLIEQRRPPIVFGEQVAAAADWLHLVRSDLEGAGYTVGDCPVEAASAGADHFRDRLWFVAHDDQQRTGEGWLQRSREQRRSSRDSQDHLSALADRDHSERRSDDAARNNHGRPPAGRHEGASDAAERRAGPLVNDQGFGWGEGWTEAEFRSRGFTAAVASVGGRQYVECHDGKWRRLPPPRVRWLGHGIAARVAKLRAIGNAIDPRPAQAFIEAVMEAA